MTFQVVNRKEAPVVIGYRFLIIPIIYLYIDVRSSNYPPSSHVWERLVKTIKLVQRCLKTMFASLVILVNDEVVSFVWTWIQFYLYQLQVDYFKGSKSLQPLSCNATHLKFVQLLVVTEAIVYYSSGLDKCDIVVLFDYLLQEMFKFILINLKPCRIPNNVCNMHRNVWSNLIAFINVFFFYHNHVN